MTTTTLESVIKDNIAKSVLTAKDLLDGKTYAEYFYTDNISKNVDDLYFMVGIDSDKFNYKQDGVEVTQATVEFEVIIQDCVYDEVKDEYTWTGDQVFCLTNDADRANVKTYLNDVPLNNTESDTDFAKGLDEDEDILLSRFLCDAVKDNTTREQLIEACQVMVKILIKNLS